MTPFFWHVLAQDEKGGIITDRAKVLSGDTFELAAHFFVGGAVDMLKEHTH